MRDDGSAYPATHWQTQRQEQSPVAFVRNTPVTATATFQVAPADGAGTVYVKAEGRGGEHSLSFPPQKIAVTGAAVEASLTSQQAVPNHVDVFDPLTITWLYGMNEEGPWYEAGASDHQVYVTLDTPITTPKPGVPLSSHPVYHSLIHLGCHSALPVMAGDPEATTPQQVFDRIWAQFAKKQIETVDGTQLTYYQTGVLGPTMTAGLLQHRDGTCGAWVTLFLDILRIQSLTYEQPIKYVYTETVTHSGFFVKEWPVIRQGASIYQLYPYMNIIPDDDEIEASSLKEGFTFFPHYFPHQWKYHELNDAIGLEGQGNNNPYSIFELHQVVFIDGKYYDPSYGNVYESLSDMSDTIVGAFYKMKDSATFNETGANFDLNEDGLYETIQLTRRFLLIDPKDVDTSKLTVPEGGTHEY